MARSDVDRVSTCRCWNTTTSDLQAYLGSVAASSLDLGQLRRFVRAWHEVDQRYGPGRMVEANTALSAILQGLLAEAQTGAQAPD